MRGGGKVCVGMFTTVVMAAFLAPDAFAQATNSGGPATLQIVEGVQTDGDVPAAQPAWGTTALTSAVYSFNAFDGIDSATTHAFALLGAPNTGHCRFRTGGTPWLEAPINLPNGALIQSVEFRVCDSNAAAGIQTFLTINAKNAAVTQPALVSTTSAETPGCVNRTFTLGAPIQVDNANKAYALEVSLGTADNTNAVCHARVNYRLQVSPTPATATFADVPVGHPFHRFVEALVAAGITGGCGPGLYCPDTPVTRGQMAVFLAVALGLHFPG